MSNVKNVVLMDRRHVMSVKKSIKYAICNLLAYSQIERDEDGFKIMMDAVRDILYDYAISEGLEDPQEYVQRTLASAGERLMVDCSLFEIFKRSIAEVEFTVRTRNCLRALEIETVEELVQYKKEELLKMRNFGKVSLIEVEQWLSKQGLHLGMTDKEIINFGK